MDLADDIRGSFSDLSAAVRNTVSPPAGTSPLRGLLSFVIVAMIGAVVFFPVLRRIPVLKRVVPK